MCDPPERLNQLRGVTLDPEWEAVICVLATPAVCVIPQDDLINV